LLGHSELRLAGNSFLEDLQRQNCPLVTGNRIEDRDHSKPGANLNQRNWGRSKRQTKQLLTLLILRSSFSQSIDKDVASVADGDTLARR
jgi:hypothetical protein